MDNYTKVTFTVFACLLSISMHAYTYKFHNKTNSDVDIAWKLDGIDEPTEQLKIAPGNVGEKNITGWTRTGLCVILDSIIVGIITDTKSTYEQPYMMSFRKDIKEIVEKNTLETLLNTPGIVMMKIKDLFGFFGSHCGGLTLSILATADNHPILYRESSL